MAPRLESLPNELWDEIVEYLDFAAPARLLQCSKSLRERIEPVLYNKKGAPDRAMGWACLNGNLTIMRLAVSYGASTGEITRASNGRCYWYIHEPVWGDLKIPTLYLAARNSHLDAFKLLLKLDAHVGDLNKDPEKRTLTHLMRKLCLRVNWDLLRRFLEAGLHAQVRLKHCPQIALPLMPLIMAGAPFDLLQMVLDRGADINQIHPYGRQRTVSPLGISILHKSVPLFHFLLERGADIHGADLNTLTKGPFHIPIFAAVEAMQSYGPEMLQLCLRNGADINRRTLFHLSTQRTGNVFTYLTPLLYVVYVLDFYELPTVNHLYQIEYLLERGASDSRPPDVSRTRNPPNFRTPSWVEIPLAFELILDCWFIDDLDNADLFSTLEFLFRRATDKKKVIEQLMKCEFEFRKWQEDKGGPVDAWRKFIDLVIQHGDADINVLLWRILQIDIAEDANVDDMMEESHQLDDKEKLRDPACFRQIVHVTVHHLLTKGANINAPIQPDGSTVLHELCRAFNDHEHSLTTWSPGLMNKWYFGHYIRQRKRLFCSFLRSREADLSIVVEGQTPIDLLLKHLESGFNVERHREYLQELAAILKGEKLDGYLDDICVDGFI